MSIPNVYPGPSSFVKQPGTAKTAQFHQKWRKIRKTQFHKNPKSYKYNPNSDPTSTRQTVVGSRSMSSRGWKYDGFMRNWKNGKKTKNRYLYIFVYRSMFNHDVWSMIIHDRWWSSMVDDDHPWSMMIIHDRWWS